MLSGTLLDMYVIELWVIMITILQASNQRIIE